MPLSFRTTFTYRSYSIGGGPPPRSRPRESHGAIEFVSLREPTRAPRYIRLGEIERKYRERGGGGEGSPRAIIPENGTRDDFFPEFFSSLKFEEEGRDGRFETIVSCTNSDSL